MKYLSTPLTEEDIQNLRVGDKVLLSGKIYTARDAAHARLVELINKGKDLPFNIEGQVLFYVGPTPAPPGRIIGSAGPTTSYRMDPFTPILLKKGLKGMIGKGSRSKEVKEALCTYRSVYFGAVGGVAALISKKISDVKLITYEDLGAEAIMCFEVQNMPLIVINDIYGGDLYEEGRKKYRQK